MEREPIGFGEMQHTYHTKPTAFLLDEDVVVCIGTTHTSELSVALNDKRLQQRGLTFSVSKGKYQFRTRWCCDYSNIEGRTSIPDYGQPEEWVKQVFGTRLDL